MKKKPSEITLLDIYKAVMEVNEIHIFDIHQNSNDMCVVGQNIKPVLSGMFKEMEEQVEMQLKAMTLENCMDIMKNNIKPGKNRRK